MTTKPDMARKKPETLVGAKEAKKPTVTAANRLIVKVFSPYQTYYSGEAASVSASNKTGPFDVLLGHANFFSLLTTGDVVIETGHTRLAFPVTRGVIKVNSDHVTVFVDV